MTDVYTTSGTVYAIVSKQYLIFALSFCCYHMHGFVHALSVKMKSHCMARNKLAITNVH